jgi:BirA family transcriptional regulator, biotin operon repressor / biotin---[acetyl-CoA-carboxylase] ligase
MSTFDVVEFQHMRRSSIGSELYYYNEIDSTNHIAEKLAQQSFREGIMVIADSQTAGRGRSNNRWFSPTGENIYCTLLLKPDISYLHRIPFVAGLAIVKTLAALGLKIDIKWPNDLLIGHRKIGGVLIQSAIESGILKYAILGFGININSRSFPADLNETATSVANELGEPSDRESILAGILMFFEKLYSEMPKISWEDFSKEIGKKSTFIKDCEVRIHNHEGISEGTTAGLDSYGGLIVNTPDGARVFYSGEVQACRKK